MTSWKTENFSAWKYKIGLILEENLANFIKEIFPEPEVYGAKENYKK